MNKLLVIAGIAFFLLSFMILKIEVFGASTYYFFDTKLTLYWDNVLWIACFIVSGMLFSIALISRLEEMYKRRQLIDHFPE